MKYFQKIKILTVFCLLAVSGSIYGQSNQCITPTPFCTGNVVNFPSTVNGGQAQQGPNYGCLGSQPNPAWFFFQMQNGGPVSINMQAALDIDFIAWGPFGCLSGVCNSLTPANQVPGSFYNTPGTNGCSYSGSNTETLTIANAVPGAYYILLITNFSNSQQNITFSQVNGNAPGAGVTNCNVLCTLTATNSGRICQGGTATLSATTGTVPASYSWLGPGTFSSSSLTTVVSNIQATTVFTIQGVTPSTGTCGATGGSTCLATTVVSVVPLPQYLVNPLNTTVCQGGSFLAAVAPTGNYAWQWAGPVNFQSPNGLSTIVTVPLITTSVATLVYSVTATPTILNCPVTTTLAVNINNPATPTLTMPAPLCNISTNTFATAQPPGGTWYGSPLIASNGIITPNLAASNNAWGIIPVSYSVSIGSCTAHATGNISMSQFQTAALTGSIPNQCVYNLPFNLQSIVANPLGNWSGVGTSANTFTAAGIPTGVYVLTYYNQSTPFANVCPASSTMAVSVFNPVTPYIAPIAPKCTDAASVALLASPAGGIWSGNSGVTPGGNYTPANSLNTAGTNTVIYTAGLGTCVASSSATFHVSRFNTAALSASALNLCVTTNSFNLMSLTLGTVAGVWTGTPALIGTSFNPAGLSGTYIYTYNTVSVPDATLCPDFRTLPITVLNPATPSISLVGPFCTADAPFQLSVNPQTGSFVPTAYLTSAGLFKPALSNVGNNVVQYVIGTSTCNVTDTKLISVEAFVPPTITGNLPDQCNTSLIQSLTPYTSNAGTWTGPGVAGSSFNPGFSGVGVISLFYNTASSPSGLCPAQGIMAVNVYSLAAPVIGLAGPFCNSMPAIKLQATPLGGIFGSNSPSVDELGWFNPAFSFIGDNIINYSVTAGPCLAYAQTTIRIEKFISADFKKYAGPFCKNDPAIDLESLAQNAGGSWSGPGLTGSVFTPSNANIGSSNNIIRYLTQSQTPELCPDTSDMRIRVNDVPNVSIVRDVEKGCAPVEVVFNTPNTNTGMGRWNLGDGSVTKEGLTVSHTYTAAGTYSVVFNYWDEIGCTSQAILSNAVTVFPVPKAAFTYEPFDEITIANPDVQFVNHSQTIGQSIYLWQIAELYSLTDVNPMVVFPKAGDYRVTLLATSQDGCKSDVSQVIVVKPEFNVFIPNSFSPNYDGLNDTFQPVFSMYGLDSKTFDMEIFDRWGTSIYHTKDYTKGWDGTIQNKGSEPLKNEVYVYKIKYKDLEGRIYNKLGYLTLVK